MTSLYVFSSLVHGAVQFVVYNGFKHGVINSCIRKYRFKLGQLIFLMNAKEIWGMSC